MGILSSIQSKIDDVRNRLAGVNQEFDALELGTTPTADLEAEEKAALKRLARKEALTRVNSALSAELAELQAQQAREQEEERARQAAKLQADIEEAKAKAVDALWAAYQVVDEWKQLANDMEQYKPGYGLHGSHEGRTRDKLTNLLIGLGAAKEHVDVATRKHTLVRV